MKKKILILSLVTVFFVSTTSLPVTEHLCKMTQTVKTCNCSMMKHCMMGCKSHSDKNVNLLSLKNNCCSTKTIDTKVKDEYLSQQKTNNNVQTLAVVLISNPFEGIEKLNLNKKYFQDFSPPLLTSNNLYLSNSVLLI